MKALYLDLASHDGLIAASNGQTILALESCDHKIGDHELLPLIEKTLQTAGWDFPDLTHIACVTGPGGFTSLRVAVTCANVLADQLHIPSAGVHLSDVWQAKVISGPRPATSKFIWLHSTKKQELFARTFGDPTWPDPTHLSLAEFTTRVPRNLFWSGELIPDHEAVVTELGMKQVKQDPVHSWLPSLVSGLLYGEKPLLPWYGRGY